MVGYAVGETVDYTNTPLEDESREEEGSGAVERQQSSHLNCYEVVTAWVHPRYGNSSNISYREIIFCSFSAIEDSTSVCTCTMILPVKVRFQ